MKMSMRRAKMAPATFALLRKACIMETLAARDRETKRGKSSRIDAEPQGALPLSS
jgi:hypothetical protein